MYNSVTVASRKMGKGDAWECFQPADAKKKLRMPAGPRANVGVAVVDSIIKDQHDQPRVHVLWYGKVGGLQSGLKCQP